MNFVAIDFETANRYRTSACAVGIVVGNENGIQDEFYSLINPLMEFEDQNIYVHGINETDVTLAPTFAGIWPTIEPYLSKGPVVAHNASFDMSVLRATLDRYELPYPEIDYLCSVMISKQVWTGLRNYKLNTIAEMIEFDFSHHHALDDSRVVIKLLERAIVDKRVNNIRELVDSCQISYGRIYERNYKTPKLRNNIKKSKNKIGI